MRLQLALAPAWVVAVFNTAFFTVCMSLCYRFSDHHPWGEALGSAAVCGAIVGIVMGVAAVSERRNREWTFGPLWVEHRREILRAADSGTPPADRTLLPVAISFAQKRLDTYNRSRTVSIVGAIGIVAFLAVLARNGNLLYAGMAVVILIALARTIAERGRLSRTLAALSAAESPSTVLS